MAIKEFGTDEFQKYDSKTKDKVSLLYNNLLQKYGYSPDCARTVALYVMDNKLVKKFED